MSPVDALKHKSLAGKTAQVAVRLRAVGNLADRLEEDEADPVYVLDLARAIVASCDQIDDEDEQG